MARKLEAKLKEYDVGVDAGTFRDILVETLHNLAPSWNDEELVHNPREALRYCDEVRARTNAPNLPDGVILRALSGMRKQSASVRAA